MNTHDFFCECGTCCVQDDQLAQQFGAFVQVDTRPLMRQAGMKKVAPVRTRYMKPGQAVGRGTVRKPSEKQLSYLKSLLASRDLTKLMLPRGVDRAILETPEEISLRGCSDLISNLKDCPVKAEMARQATEGQVKYIRSLVDQKTTGDEHAALLELIDGGVTFDLASSLINSLKNRADVAKTERAGTELEEGVYRYEGNAARVVRSNAGRMYASLWNAETQDWDYVSGLVRKITTEDRMTLAEMAAFGQAFGRCGHCNRKLTKKESMEAGIGPICAKGY